MYKVKQWLFIFLCIISNGAIAQSISMEFPAFSGKSYDLIIFQGSKSITVVQDTIPQNGKFKLTIPKEYAPYTGMCRWLFTNSAEGGGIDMAIPGHDFSISCLSNKPDNTNIVYTGFDAVNELNRLDGVQQKIINKFEAMSKASDLYGKKHPLYASFQKEKAVQMRDYEDFHRELKKNTNFNARFLPIVNLIRGYAHRLSNDDNEKGLIFNEFFTQKMNIQDLYVSGHWEGIIQSWVVLHINVIKDKDKFAQDFKIMSEKIKSPIQYTDFVGKVTRSLTQYGKDDYIDTIAQTVLSSGKVTEYLESMQVYLKAIVGMQAPDLAITEHIGKLEDHNHTSTILKSSELAMGNYTQTLLVFYQSGCGPCEVLMQQLPQKYKALKEKGIRVISLSADENELLYKNSSKDYPWPDKYCDFEGKNGVNFKNYAVKGTPTMFLLDSKGIIIEKFATIEQLLAWGKKK